LLTGGVALDDYLPPKPKNSDFISMKMWGEMYRLSLMEKFKPFFDSINNETE